MRRHLQTCFGLSLLFAAYAGAEPVPGTYSTPDLGGAMLPGRATTSRMAPEPEMWHAMSWDGSTLGTQWRFRCAGSTSATILEDTRNGQGTGTFVFERTFAGGTFFLSGAHAWSADGEDIVGNLVTMTIIQTQEWELWTRVSAHDDIIAQGRVADDVCSVTFSVENGVQVGTDLAIPDYPDYLHSDCVNVRSFGQSMDFPGEISLEIDCTVDTEEKTWTGIKSLYQ